MNVKMTLRRNSPKLLAILAAMGTVSTAFATARATPKALLLIREAVLFDGYSKEYCNTNITCEHKDKCKRLKDMIEKEVKKRND